MDKYMKQSDVIAYIRKEAKEAQSAFEELGGESGIIAEAFEDQEIWHIEGNPCDMQYRRSDCPLIAVGGLG